MDTDLLRIITRPADELSGGTNIDDLERPWTPPPNMGFKWFFGYLGCDAHWEWIFAEIYWRYRPRQPAYEIKLMLSRVSWALTQISCFTIILVCSIYFRSSKFSAWPRRREIISSPQATMERLLQLFVTKLCLELQDCGASYRNKWSQIRIMSLAHSLINTLWSTQQSLRGHTFELALAM